MNKETVEKQLQEAVQKIVDEYQPEKIILFGSWAWGNPGPDSDVDLFIVKDTVNTRETAREIDGSLFPRPFPLDLIVYKPEQAEREKEANFFIRSILTKGKLLYAR